MDSVNDSKRTAFEAMVREAIADWKGHPTYAWAGDCGIFAGWVWDAGREVGMDITMDSLDSRLNCDGPLVAPPGISIAELEGLNVPRGLNHVWLVWDSRCYDAAHPEGVDQPFELRCLRQALVEMLQIEAPERLQQLCAEHTWWAESAQLLESFLALHDEREANYVEN